MNKNSDLTNKLINQMTIDDLCGQLINFNVSGNIPLDEFEKIAKRIRPGAIFVAGTDKEHIKKYTDIVNKYTKVPVIVSADIENGAGSCLWGERVLPEPMAWGAADDAELIEKAGTATAEICRNNGIHWNFAPIVDINYNKDNPVVNTRAISDSPQQVVKIASAYVRGMQKNNLMLAGCKHFPGDGVDDRNQHFCTTINSMSKDEWMKTYGYVYKKMFEAGTASVMVGHIAFPAVEDYTDPILGPKPGSLSYNVMTKLLREELGFDGCIVSDAMSMVGACSMCATDRLAVEFIKAGGDMVLFALESDFDNIKKAVDEGELSIQRIKKSVEYVLNMKARANLFESFENNMKMSMDIAEISNKIAEKSIKIVRNSQNVIPLKLKKNAKILVINIKCSPQDEMEAPYIKQLDVVVDELARRGYQVDSMSAIGVDHHKLETEKSNYDCILINCRISSRDYIGGTLRINRDNIMPFWRGTVINHPCVIFTSFGDPYKLYDLPFLRNYINAFSSSIDTQKAFVKVLLGEIPAKAKNPVGLKDFFTCEV